MNPAIQYEPVRVRPTLPRLMRVKDAARYLALSPAKIRTLVQEGEIQAVKPGANAPWLLDLQDLDRWIANHKD